MISLQKKLILKLLTCQECEFPKFAPKIGKWKTNSQINVSYRFPQIYRALYGDATWVTNWTGNNMVARNQQKDLSLSFTISSPEYP